MYGLIGISIVGVASAQDSTVPDEINDILSQNQVTEEEYEQVEDWYFENGDDLLETTNEEIGIWLRETEVDEDTGTQSVDINLSDTDETDDTGEEETQQVEANLNDAIDVVTYNFDRDESEVTITLRNTSSFSESVVLTDFTSIDSEGVSSINQKEVSIDGNTAVETTFQVEFDSLSGNSTVGVSAGVNEAVALSNDSVALVDQWQWSFIPVAVSAGALAVLISGLVFVWKEYRKVNSEYTNVFKNI